MRPVRRQKRRYAEHDCAHAQDHGAVEDGDLQELRGVESRNRGNKREGPGRGLRWMWRCAAPSSLNHPMNPILFRTPIARRVQRSLPREDPTFWQRFKPRKRPPPPDRLYGERGALRALSATPLPLVAGSPHESICLVM